MYAWNGHIDLLQVLVHAKADIGKARTYDGATPAFIATQNGHTDSLQVRLVHAKADIDKVTTDYGKTPAFWAAWNGHADSLQVLEYHGTRQCRNARVFKLTPSCCAKALRLLFQNVPYVAELETSNITH